VKKIFKGDFKVTQGYSTAHGGIDIVGIGDINVISPVDGIVRSSTIITDKGNLTWEWGNYVRVDDNSGNRYYFCHLKSRNVKVGDTVKTGDVLGVIGNTGKSFGAHSHFETRTRGNYRTNPAEFLEIPNEERTYLLKNNWQKLKRWLYFDENRNPVTGFRTINNKLYFFAKEDFDDIKKSELIITDDKGEII